MSPAQRRRRPRCPLLLGLVALGHVCRIRRKARCVLARVCRHQLSSEVSFHQRVTGVEFELLADVLMGYRVAVLFVLDVIVDIDLDRLDGHIPVGLAGERLQGRLVQLFKRRAAAAGQLLKGAGC